MYVVLFSELPCSSSGFSMVGVRWKKARGSSCYVLPTEKRTLTKEESTLKRMRCRLMVRRTRMQPGRLLHRRPTECKQKW